MNPSLQIEEPKFFKLRHILFGNLISGALGGISGIMISCAIVGPFLFLVDSGLALLITTGGLIASGLVVFFLPVVLLANPYIKYIARKCSKNGSDSVFSVVCQIRLFPRVYTGFRGFMDDADDIGQLQISQGSLAFRGDHIQCFLPFGCIEKIDCKNVGWRGGWLYGHRIKIQTSVFGKYEGLELAERHSITLISSHRITNRIISLISE